MNSALYKKLSFLNSDLITELIQHAVIKKVPKGIELFTENQYIKVLPIVLKGSVKVFSRFEERELLLYYIRAKQSCVMSFASCLKNKPSRICATTEEDSEILLMPVEKIQPWLHQYPSFGNLFHEQYDLRYTELLATIQHVLIDKMDKRLYDYLLQKAEVTGRKEITISHSQIANELGTVREVISRVMKKLELEGKVIQQNRSIKLIEM